MALLVTHECPECGRKGYLAHEPCAGCGYDWNDRWTDTVISQKDIESTAVYQQMATEARFRSKYVRPRSGLTTRLYNSLPERFRKPIDRLWRIFHRNEPSESAAPSAEEEILRSIQMFNRMDLCSNMNAPEAGFLEMIYANPVRLSVEEVARLPGVYAPSEYALSHLTYRKGYECVTKTTTTGFEPNMEVTFERRVIYRLSEREFTYVDETETRSNNPGDRPGDH